jgi:hypothetical protein
MTDVVEKISIRRDRALEARLLDAVITDQNSRPRNQQVQVGPSSIGYCRELARAEIFEGVHTQELVAPLTHWPTAAHVGSAMGEELERIFGERLAQVITQQRVTTFFDKLGVSISGAIDLAFIDEDHVSDLKSVDDMGGMLYDLDRNAELIETLLMIWREDKLFAWNVETPDGGYELTQILVNKFAKLKYWIQVSVYVVGAIQAGLLSPDAEGRLIFYDRSGAFQEFVAIMISSEEVEMFYDLGQARVEQIAQAQELFERTGNLHLIHQLRDQTPSFCFSPKVMCPLRERCWGGSEWEPEQVLDSPEISNALDRYIEGRRLAQLGEGMKKSAKTDLKGIEGTTPDGRKVSWPGGRINVVETAKGHAQGEHRPARSAVDMAVEAMARVAVKPEDPTELAMEILAEPVQEPHVHTTSRGTKACSEGRCNPKTIVEQEPGPYFEGAGAEVSHDWKGEPQASDSKPEPGLHVGGPMDPSEGFDADELPEITLEAARAETARGADGNTGWDDPSEYDDGAPREEPEPNPGLGRVSFVDTDLRPLEEAPEPDPGAYLRPDEYEAQVTLDGTRANWPTPAEEVLANTPELTDAQRAYLERVAERRGRLDDMQKTVASERRKRHER